jgi:multidrug efflux system outer membrane protein
MSPGELPRGLSNTDQPVMPIIPAGLPSTLLSQRPDLKQAEYIYMRETERIGVALAQRLPTLSLTVAGGFSNPELSGLLGSGALGVSITEGLLGPLFEFGRNKRRVTAQMKSAEIAAFDYRQIYLKSLVEVENALVSIETLNKELNARQRMLTAARQALELSRARYESGYTSYLELMDAERSLFEMEILVSSVRQQQLNAYVELYRALGGG